MSFVSSNNSEPVTDLMGHHRFFAIVQALLNYMQVQVFCTFKHNILRVAMSNENREDDHPVLSEEDQARVDHFIRTGVNATEKKPFRPILLVVLLISVVTGFSLLSQILARMAGVY